MLVPETELIISAEGQELLRRTLQPGEFTLGRSPTCDICIPSNTVSRKHARLTINFSNLFLEDLGSFNGTSVNGGQITGRTQIWHGQQILVGTVLLKLRKICTDMEQGGSLAPAQSLVFESLPEDVTFQHGGYQVGQLLGRGGMGAVLQAEDSSIQRQVAMKVVLRGDSTGDVLRFIHEARITGQLEHPNIIPVHTLGSDEHGQPFYTMKLVRGATLHQALKDLSRGEEDAVRLHTLPALLTVFQKVCDAIRFAHSQKVIHRDLKPDNIMLGDFGEVMVMDWGLAKKIGPKEQPESSEEDPSGDAGNLLDGIDYRAEANTMTGAILGTPQYMPPEQAAGNMEVLNERADIYSLGAILYHTLTLQPPVIADSAEHLLQKVISGDILTPKAAVRNKHRHSAPDSETVPVPAFDGDDESIGALPHLPAGRIPASLEAVVLKAMSHVPENRYPSVAELQKDITAYQTGFATTAEHAGILKLLYLFIKRHKTISIAASLAVLLTGAFTVQLFREVDRSSRALARLGKAAPLFFESAKTQFHANRSEEALEKVDFAIEVAPQDPEYQRLRALILQRLGRATEAEAATQKANHLSQPAKNTTTTAP